MKFTASLFIIITIVVIAVVDFYLIAQGGTEASISHQIIVWSYEFPAFTFLMGFTMGHLFWKIRDVKKESK